MLDDDARDRVLSCLLVSQRHSWAQGRAAAVLEARGAKGALRALVDDAVARQLPDGRLGGPGSGLWTAPWDDDAVAPADPRAWGTGNGWVAAGLARALRHLPCGCREIVAREVRDLLDACLPYRRPDGLFGDVLDDPAG